MQKSKRERFHAPRPLPIHALSTWTDSASSPIHPPLFIRAWMDGWMRTLDGYSNFQKKKENRRKHAAPNFPLRHGTPNLVIIMSNTADHECERFIDMAKRALSKVKNARIYALIITGLRSAHSTKRSCSAVTRADTQQKPDGEPTESKSGWPGCRVIT
jgi:hypothetical protein